MSFRKPLVICKKVDIVTSKNWNLISQWSEHPFNHAGHFRRLFANVTKANNYNWKYVTLQKTNNANFKGLGVRFMVFNATLNNISVISWRSILLVDETGILGENHRPAASHWQTLSHNAVSSTPRHERDSNPQHN